MADPKFKTGYRLGIVNPLTLVGGEIQSVLRQRAFPYDRIKLLDSAGAAIGALTEAANEPVFVTAVSDDELEDLDLVFFCGPAAANREWIERHDEDRFAVIDLSQPTTTTGAKAGVAGINLEDITSADQVIVSPHPVAIPIGLILHQIQKVTPIDWCAATVVQPASEFEQEGVEELARQTFSVLNVQGVQKGIFDRQLAFNLYPAPERREEFIIEQIRRLIEPKLNIAVLITQGTIFHGHTFSLFVRGKNATAQQALETALRENPAIAFPEGDQQFGTIDAAGKDEVLIAEVRPDPGIRNGFWIWAVCDNLRRSSALNAVLLAEKVLFGTATN